MRIADPVNEVFRMFERYGSGHYDEEVTLEEHCRQTAALAMLDSAPDALVAASLLHDIGHFLLTDFNGREDFRSTSWNHDRVAADWLRPRFGRAVAEPVGGHVSAKRWLCFDEPDYVERLTPPSVESLAVQGGPFDAAGADAFTAQPFAADAIRLRRWDDRGKVAGLSIPSLAEFEPLLVRLVVG